MGARKNAFTLLVEMGHAFLRFGSNQEGEPGGCRPGVHMKSWRELSTLAPGRTLLWSPQSPSLTSPSWFLSPEALQRYLVLIYPGLVGAVTMVSCSILALTHLLFEFKGKYFPSLKSGQGVSQSRRRGARREEEPEPALPTLLSPPLPSSASCPGSCAKAACLHLPCHIALCAPIKVTKSHMGLTYVLLSAMCNLEQLSSSGSFNISSLKCRGGITATSQEGRKTRGCSVEHACNCARHTGNLPDVSFYPCLTWQGRWQLRLPRGGFGAG